MADAKTEPSPELLGFILGEAHRQNTMILEIADGLQTKVGLYLVFAVFVFTSLIELIKAGRVGSIVPDVRFAVLSASLVLVAMLYLLRAALVRDYVMPPLVDRFREQVTQIANSLSAKGYSAADGFLSVQGKLVNSLARAVANNFQQNQEVSGALSVAAWLLAISILCLVLSVAFPALVPVFA